MNPGNPVVDVVLQTAVKFPDKVAIVETGGREVSYGTLSRNIHAVAASLVAQGFEKGDRVLFLAKPRIDSLTTGFAILQLGGSVVVADPAMGREVFASRVAAAKPRWLLVDSLLLVVQRISFLRAYLRKKNWELPDVSRMEGRLITVGSFSMPMMPLSYQTMLKSHKVPQFAKVEDDDESVLVFTSGTTGSPKGVIHSVASIRASSDIISRGLDFQPDDVIFADQLFLILPALAVGATIVLPTDREFLARRLLRHLETYRITKLFGVPHEFQQIVDLCRQENRKLPSILRSISLGAAPVYTAFLKKFREVIGENTRVYSVYGMTEILPVAFVDLDEKVRFNGVGDLLGRVLPEITVRITDDGEIAVSGPNMFHRLLGEEVANEHLSGDLGAYLPDGRLVLLGRKKDMIIKGNHNIYPTVFESIIRGIPGVKDCAMIGIYDSALQDERIVLVVEIAKTADKVNFEDFLRNELMSGRYSIDMYAQPDEVLFMAIPLTGRSQKVDKVTLRRSVQETLSR